MEWFQMVQIFSWSINLSFMQFSWCLLKRMTKWLFEIDKVFRVLLNGWAFEVWRKHRWNNSIDYAVHAVHCSAIRMVCFYFSRVLSPAVVSFYCYDNYHITLYFVFSRPFDFVEWQNSNIVHCPNGRHVHKSCAPCFTINFQKSA